MTARLAVDSMLLRWERLLQVRALVHTVGLLRRADGFAPPDRARRDAGLGRSQTLRPALSLRRLSATIHKGKVTAEIGRQFIRWGKTDILNPTDRFAPKDYLSSVVDSDFLGVAAARLTYRIRWQHHRSGVAALVYAEPHAAAEPALDRRACPGSGIAIIDAGARYPGGSQYGARWNHVGSGYEYPLCFFDGFNNLPLFSTTFDPVTTTVALQRYYPELRLYGGDAAVPLRWFTVKGEAAYFSSTTPDTDQYALYVIQLERQVKEWSFVGGYAGEIYALRETRSQFAPDRGFARSFVGRAGLTIDANRSLADPAVSCGWILHSLRVFANYGQHWRATERSPGFAVT